MTVVCWDLFLLEEIKRKGSKSFAWWCMPINKCWLIDVCEFTQSLDQYLSRIYFKERLVIEFKSDVLLAYFLVFSILSYNMQKSKHY